MAAPVPMDPGMIPHSPLVALMAPLRVMANFHPVVVFYGDVVVMAVDSVV